ncbi:MAG: hypothetical protein QM774_13220 [Gordonia sp. (in: high G+C Gram-positive bacteria)]|uniref:YncE family protein n=1 Tax=Gordonia sp. (in: high G+C Gram-positive bacteria) TaxID=84139 RepID=UPI0039E6C53B
MTLRSPRARAIALALATATTLGTAAAVAPAAQAAPAPSAGAVQQTPGYHVTGYNVGKGNYRAAIDPQSGDMWLTNVSPMGKPAQSQILQLNPADMSLKKRITITRKAQTGGHGFIAGAYDIGVPKTGNTVWTTGAPSNQVTVWDKSTGRELKYIDGVEHAHEITFAEDLGLAIVSTKGAALQFFDLNTFEKVGSASFPGGGQHLGAGIAVTDESASGATVTVTDYYRNLTQFRVTRDGGAVQSKVLWNTRQAAAQGHGSVVADTRTNRIYVNELMGGTVSAFNLRTGKHIGDITTGPGTNSMMIFHGKLYAADYFANFISVIDQKNLAVTQRITTGLMPNQLVPWKKNTFLVVDKSSSAAELPAGVLELKIKAPAVGVDHVWKVTKTG